MPPLVTLTTDFGPGPFAGVMKGVMAGICPECRFIDLTHQVPPQDLAAGAEAVLWTLEHFPAGTVHLAVVDPGVGTARRGLAVEAGGRFWVGPDNGLFTPVFLRHGQARAFELAAEEFFLSPISNTFHGRDIFAPVAAALAGGLDPARLGPAMSDPVLLSWPRPAAQKDRLVGQVVAVDAFGNLASNIWRGMVLELLGKDPGEVLLAGLCLKGPLATYAQAEPGQPLALFDSLGRLELAVNQGSMLKILGLCRESALKLPVIVQKAGLRQPR